MVEGIIEGEKLSDTGLDWIVDIYKASGLSWTFAGKMNNPYLNAIRSNDIIEKSKAQGMSNEQIQEKILEDSVLGSAIAPVDVNGILNLFDNGASKEDIIRFAAVADFGKFTDAASKGKSIEQTLKPVKSWEQARNNALNIVGDLGVDSKPVIGRLEVSVGYW